MVNSVVGGGDIVGDVSGGGSEGNAGVVVVLFPFFNLTLPKNNNKNTKLKK